MTNTLEDMAAFEAQFNADSLMAADAQLAEVGATGLGSLETAFDENAKRVTAAERVASLGTGWDSGTGIDTDPNQD